MKKITLSSIALVITVLFIVAEDRQVQAEGLLNYGSSGQEVLDVQRELSNMGYLNGKLDGNFGSQTERAVKDFQFEANLQVDGIVGVSVHDKIADIERMARVVHGEARGESHEGKVGVAAVILNRLHSNQFPDSIKEVITQTNAFTAFHDGQYDLTPNNSAYQAVIEALNGRDPTNGATYYYNPETAQDQWIFTRQAIVDIGNHTFAS